MNVDLVDVRRVVLRVHFRDDHIDEIRLDWTAGELTNVPREVVHARRTSIEEIRRQLDVLVEESELIIGKINQMRSGQRRRMTCKLT